MRAVVNDAEGDDLRASHHFGEERGECCAALFDRACINQRQPARIGSGVSLAERGLGVAGQEMP